MNTESLRSSDIALAVGARLMEICARFGRLELRAYNEERYETFEITINRMISFSLDDRRGAFDPGLSTHDPREESGNFIFLIGKSIDSIA